jgi:hypothetical protein
LLCYGWHYMSWVQSKFGIGTIHSGLLFFYTGFALAIV